MSRTGEVATTTPVTGTSSASTVATIAAPPASAPLASVPKNEALQGLRPVVPEFPVGPTSGGSELDWFLGSVLPIDVLMAARTSHHQAMAQCMADQGFDEYSAPPEFPDEVRLRFEDPVAFAERYGYGYFAVDVGAVSNVEELDDAVPDYFPPTDERNAASDKCSAEHPYPLLGNLAGVSVSNRAYALQSELLASDPEYLAALDSWIDCMQRHDATVTVADGARDLVGGRFDDFVFVHSPGRYVISDGDLAEAIAFERSVYEIDAACGLESGRYEEARDIDRRVIETVRAETGFDGAEYPVSP